MEDNNMNALKMTLALKVMQKKTEEIIESLMIVAQKMDIDINELNIMYFSDGLETAICVADKMGVKVDLDGFFGACKDKINHDIEHWNPSFSMDQIREMLNLAMGEDNPVSNS